MTAMSINNAQGSAGGASAMSAGAPGATRVLLVEDNPGHAKLVERALTRSLRKYEVYWKQDLASALALISECDVPVVLLDLSLPDSEGMDTVAAIRKACGAASIVVLTSLADDKMAMAALEHGAQDYLGKDALSSEGLDRAIRYAIQRQQNYTEMQRLLSEVSTAHALLERKNRHLARLYRTAHRFVDNVSHEFRTPLTVIKEYVALVREGLLGSVTQEQSHYLDVVSDRADDLNHMVDDMLDVSKLQAGILSVHRTNCRVADMVDRVRTGIEKRAALKGVTFDVDLADNLPLVYCDAEKIGRVLINLAVNAIKFCGDPGSVTLWARRAPDAPEVLLGVTDNGRGIDAANFSMIFERFKQIGSNPRGSTKGFGLGLSIARELVSLNLGSMQVESALGAGSTFSFSVPVADPTSVLRKYLDEMPARRGNRWITLVRAELDADATPHLVEDMSYFLHGLLRRRDLLLQSGPQSWLVALRCPELEWEKFLVRAAKELKATNRNRPGTGLPAPKFEYLGTWDADSPAGLVEHFRCVPSPQEQGDGCAEANLVCR